MFKKIIFLSLFLILFTRFSYSQERAIAYYNAPFEPYTQTVIYEPMLAIPSPPLVAPESGDVASRALMPSNDFTVNYSPTPKVHTYTRVETTTDPVIRDFRYFDKVYEPQPKITSAGDVKSKHPIRDFRTDYWKNKYYRDEFHNQELYKETYKNYNYYH